MFRKLLLVFVLFAYEGHCLTEITLPDENVNYTMNGFFGPTMSIAKLFTDTLSSCHIIFPNGVMYEAFPQSTIPDKNVYLLESVQPFQGCSIGFGKIGTEYSGTYELLSTVLHSADYSVSLTRQKFHLVVKERTEYFNV